MLALAAQHQIELEQVLPDLNHNLPLLHTTLSLFGRDALHMSKQIPVLLAAQEHEQLRHLLHTLKSAAAIVGARHLSGEASRIEEKLENGRRLTRQSP